MHHRLLIQRLIVLFLLLPLLATAWAEEDLLRPEQAFPVSAEATAADELSITWDSVDGYYLYKSKIGFHSDTPGITLGEPVFPPAKVKHDEFFGDVEIYRGRQTIRLPLTRSAGAAGPITLEAKSQGCADQGICYPPQRQTLTLELPPMARAEAEPAQPPAPEEPDSGLAALASLSQELGLAEEEDEILDPEDAFRFDASVEGPQQLRLVWAIAEGTYLYKEKLRIDLEGAEGVAIGAHELPPAKVKHDSVRPDGSVGDVEVYQQEIDLRLPLQRSAAEPTDITLVARFQGCAERGICYPPITRKVQLALPAAQAGTLSAVQADPPPATKPQSPSQPVTEQDRIAATLVQGNAWLIVATFFGFGLLLALTPCIFPMIPILSGIIAGQGKQITPYKAFVLSLVYVLAMALTYTAAGVLAGLFGANLQAWFQNPWILGSFSLVFVALAFSMFGFYELQLPSALQSRLTEISNKQQGGTLIGVAIMGLLSALIVGPCVAPPLAGALIYIGQTGDGLLGGMALFALSMGMGVPLIAIGTSAGKLLPRAGAWMDNVKAVFGVALLGVAIVLLERILPAAVAMLLWGALLISSGVYLGALRDLPVEATGWQRLWKSLGVVLLIYGALMLVGAAAGGKDTLQPLRGLAVAGGGTEQRHLSFQRIKSVADLEREVAGASAKGRPVMLDFYADWCVSCKELERYTFSDPKVLDALEGFVLLQADVTANDEQDQALLQERFGLHGPPAILFYGADGRERRNHRVVGFMPATEFADHVKRALQ